MWYVYVLKNREGKLYIGYTSDLKRRAAEHARKHSGYKLLYYEAYDESISARKREHNLKQFGGAWRSLKKRLSLERAG